LLTSADAFVAGATGLKKRGFCNGPRGTSGGCLCWW